MSKEEMKRVIYGAQEAIMKNDAGKLASIFTEDSTAAFPMEIAFKGPESAKTYLNWIYSEFTKLTLKETGLVIEGNRAAYEYVLEGTTPEGLAVSIPGVAIYEFKDGKVRSTRSYYDVLSMAKQAAKGWLAERAIRSIEKQYKKGLR